MANKEEWRVACNETNCRNQGYKMPENCNIIIFGSEEKDKDYEIEVSNNNTRNMPKELILETTIKAYNGGFEESKNVEEISK